MTAIACLDAKNGIGKDNKLLISIPEDMKFFRENTKDSVVIMGRKTLFSFKDKAPLKNRINIVFTSNINLQENYKDYDNIFFIKTKKELDNLLKNYKNKKVFLIGGAKVYSDLIDECDRAYITKLDKEFDADVFFPKLEEKGFVVEHVTGPYKYEDINYSFITYTKFNNN